MTMNTISKFSRLARNLAIGVLAIGAATVMLPAAAVAGPSNPHEISQRIDRIAYEVAQVDDIRSPKRQIMAINDLQRRLSRLERIVDNRNGRWARENGKRIDRLQYRLHRLERQAAYRPAPRQEHWNYNRRGSWN